MCTKFNLKIDESTELLDTKHLMTTIQMNCYYYPIPLNNHALNFYSILILSAALIVEAFISLRLEKTVKEDNAINVIIVNEDSLIVQII